MLNKIESQDRDGAKILSGAALGAAALLLATPFLARIYSPTDFGVLGLFLSYVGFASSIASLRLENTVLSARTDEDAARLLLLSLMLAFASSCLAGVLIIPLGQHEILGFERIPASYSPIVAVSVLSTSTFFLFRYWQIRTNQYTTVAAMSTLQNAGRVAVQISLSFVMPGSPGLLLGVPLGYATGLVVGLPKLQKTLSRNLRDGLLPSISLLRESYRYPLYGVPSTVLDTGAALLPLPLIVSHWGLETAGLYALAQSLLAGGTSLVARSIGDAFQGHFSREWHKDKQASRRLFWRTARLLLLIFAPACVLTMLLAPPLVVPVLGERWADSGTIILALSPMIFASSIVSPLSRIVFLTNGQALKLLYDASAVAVALLTLGLPADREFSEVLWAFSLLSVGTYGIYFLLLAFLISSMSRKQNS